MTTETGELIKAVGAVAAVVGFVGSAVGTVIGSKIGVTWLEKRQNDLREWIGDIDTKVTNHGERIAKVEGICETTRLKNGGKC